MRVILALLVVLGGSASAQSVAPDARTAALQHVLDRGLLSRSGADYELIRELTVRRADSTPDSILNAEGRNLARVLGNSRGATPRIQVLDCASSCKSMGIRPALVVGRAQERDGVTMVRIETFQTIRDAKGEVNGGQIVEVVVERSGNGWVGTRVATAVAGTSTRVP